MAYQEPKKRTIRLDDDVYEALRKLPESPNKFLRKVLSADGTFRTECVSDVVAEVERGPKLDLPMPPSRKPLLKPKERK